MNAKLKNILLIIFIVAFPLMVKSTNTLIPLNAENNKLKTQKISEHWKFYWKQFIPVEGDSFEYKGEVINDVKLPSYWSEYSLNGVELPGKGYGSYTKTIILPAGYRDPIGILIPSVDVAFRFYINGVLQTVCGKATASAVDEIPEYHPELVKFIPYSDTLQLVFQVSNFHHRRGGLWKDISLGDYETIQKSYNSDYFYDLFSLGILISFGLFFLIFSFYYRSGKSIFYLSICFMFIFLRGICTNYYTVQLLIPISWITMIRLEYVSDFLSVLMGAWGFYYFKPKIVIKKSLQWTTILLIPVLGSIFLLPIYYFAYSIYILYIIFVFCLILLVVQVYAIVKAGGPTSLFYLFGMFLLIFATVNDLLVSNSNDLFFDFYILPKAFLLFIVILSIEFFRRFVETYNHEKELGLELAELNKDLQKKVDERTASLNEKKIIIESQNELLKKDITLKNKILSIIGHDIRSPLSFITMGIDLVIDQNLPEESKNKFMDKIRFSAYNLFLLVDNLLSWGLSQNKQLKLFIEQSDVIVVIERVMGQFLPIAENKEVEFEKKIPPTVMAWFDENSVTIVVRNLISNAIKFTPHNGKITIMVEEFDHFVEVKIADTGVGIPPDDLKHIIDESEIVTNEGTDHEKGTGLGLTLCKELVSLNGGKFMIQSEQGVGSIFSFTIPKDTPK